MASGASIHELNRLRTSLSAVKGGKLADRSLVPVVTLVISDVVGDDPHVIGSGPTVRDTDGDGSGDRVEVIAPMSLFGEAVQAALAERGGRPAHPRVLRPPEDVARRAIAQHLGRERQRAGRTGRASGDVEQRFVFGGELIGSHV